MKFKHLNEENFITKGFEKLKNIFKGYEFTRNCKKEGIHPEEYFDKKVLNVFEKNGYYFLFSERRDIWWKGTDFDNIVFINKSLSKLVIVNRSDTGDNFIVVYNKGNYNLLKPSYGVLLNYYPKKFDEFKKNLLKTIDDICNDREDNIQKVSVNGKYVTALFKMMQEVNSELGIQNNPEYELEQLELLTGGIFHKIPRGIIRKGIEEGCTLSQLLFLVRMILVMDLGFETCIEIASKYYV